MADLSWEKLRELVYARANGCCEYCQTCESNTGQTMHIDHILPNGDDSPDNLCLACWNCNSSKHKAIRAPDPTTGLMVGLFNPRLNHWTDHFEWTEEGSQIRGLTAVGRATVERLKMNRPVVIVARQRWVAGGHHPHN